MARLCVNPEAVILKWDARRSVNSGVSPKARRRIAASVAIIGFLLPLVVSAQSQPSAGARFETTPLPTSAIAGITEIPLSVDMKLAKQFVSIGFGPMVLGETGFQSTQFLTPTLSTLQASELVLLVPEYGHFKGAAVAKGIQGFAGRVSGVAFGREGSPVLYVQMIVHDSRATRVPYGECHGSWDSFDCCRRSGVFEHRRDMDGAALCRADSLSKSRADSSGLGHSISRCDCGHRDFDGP
jgi:hypothetical protein